MIAEALMCMALNIYHEARNQSIVGQVAVAEVVMNRVEDSRFPDTICEVVKQAVTYKNTDKPVLHKCQFSWYCDGQKDVIWANYEKTGQTIEGNARAWRESVQLAIYILEVGTMMIKDNTHGATFYYAHNLVYPHWADSKQYIGVLGNHTFMK